MSEAILNLTPAEASALYALQRGIRGEPFSNALALDSVYQKQIQANMSREDLMKVQIDEDWVNPEILSMASNDS